MHQAQNVAAGKRTLDVELLGLRIGDFVLVDVPRRADRARSA